MSYNLDLVNHIFNLSEQTSDGHIIPVYATVDRPTKFYPFDYRIVFPIGWRELDKVTKITDITEPEHILVFPGDQLDVEYVALTIDGKIYIRAILRRLGILYGFIEVDSFEDLILAPDNKSYLLPQPEDAEFWNQFKLNLTYREATQLYEENYILNNNNAPMKALENKSTSAQPDTTRYTPFTDNKPNEMESTATIEIFEEPLLTDKPITPKTVIKTGDTLIKTDTGTVSNPPPKTTNKTQLLIGAGILFAAIKLLKK